MTSRKAIDALRERMSEAGFSVRAIALAIMNQHGQRPRAAWRLANGLTQEAATARYNQRYGLASRAALSPNRLSIYERWPHAREVPSSAMLCRLAEMYGAQPADLIDELDRQRVPRSHIEVFQNLLRGDSVETVRPPSDPDLDVAYRRTEDEADLSDPEGVVMAAAHEGSERAENAERRDIGDATLDQLRADVVRLSHAHMTADPFPTFQEMRRVRRRLYDVLDRQLWPSDQADLYFLVAMLNCLMAASANSLGSQQAAEELVRAGWAYATAIDHRALKAQLRLELSGITYWQRPRQSRDLARAGLEYLSDGPQAAQLHLRLGRAAARIGDAEGARQAIAAAHEARARDHHDEVLEIGGEFGLSLATMHLYAGSVLNELPDGNREAIDELRQTVALYEAGPEPDEYHYHGYVTGSRVDLAGALLHDGQLDAAAEALAPVLASPANRRIHSLVGRFIRVRNELAAARYRGQTLAADLDETIESFTGETIGGDLRELSPGSA